ncbi:hypothetical protein C1U99_004552 [Escherichia coli]|nr:hypothetical protein [Escherichia coli]EGS5093336.1 hypothetical protein [Escherichia coli]EHC2875833.1 hypothetical protein [Escherichia coli]EHD1130501.1 hypothetical protein [Escherichia coli]EHH7445616.1 hypothetical protein [Escherichia coli]
MAITSAFQADDAGSIPAARSSKTNEVQVFQHWRFFLAGKGLVYPLSRSRIITETSYDFGAVFFDAIGIVHYWWDFF